MLKVKEVNPQSSDVKNVKGRNVVITHRIKTGEIRTRVGNVDDVRVTKKGDVYLVVEDSVREDFRGINANMIIGNIVLL